MPAPEATEAFNFPLVGSGAAYCRTAYINQLKEALINSSFRPERSGEPESSALNTIGYWIIRFAHPAGRPLGVQRATRFCPAFAGMTEE
jgi:hypothetical protein